MNKKPIDIQLWERKEHFKFFSQFEEPFFCITVTVDCTKAYKAAKESNDSFFLYYLYRGLKAANEIENFRYRIIDNQVFVFDVINASPTINRSNNTFGFAYIDYDVEESIFNDNAKKEIEKVRMSDSLLPAVSGENVIHFSSIPWLSFSSISHARSFSYPDSCPKISFGKIEDKDGIMTMPVSVNAHHGLMDAYHVGLFINKLQELLNE